MENMQLAIDQSIARHDSGFAKLLEAEAKGLFCVVAETAAFCPSTEAEIGRQYQILKKFLKPQSAVDYLAEHTRTLQGDEAFDPELLFYVYPSAPVAQGKTANELDLAAWSSDVPF